MNFRKWLEDTGEVYSNTNDIAYAQRGIGSKITSIDKKRPLPLKVEPSKLFGKNAQIR